MIILNAKNLQSDKPEPFIYTLFFFILFVIFIPSIDAQSFSDSISGTVVDIEQNKPVQLATVYVDGTSIGCYTGTDGKFVLRNIKVPCQIVVSHISFQPQVIDLKITDKPLNIFLVARVVKLNEVNVQSVSTRKKYVDEFKNLFLGTGYWGGKAKLLNDSVLFFKSALDFKNDSANFSAKATAPLEVDLPLLGYRLRVDLIDFKKEYNLTFHCFQNSFLAKYYFIPVAPKNENALKKIKKNRELAYYNSGIHFLRSLYNGSLNFNGYDVFPKNIATEIDTLRKDNDIVSLKGLKNSNFTIYYYQNSKGYPVNINTGRPEKTYESKIYFLKDTCIVHSDGTIEDNSIAFDNEIGMKKVGAMLPQNYEPSNTFKQIEFRNLVIIKKNTDIPGVYSGLLSKNEITITEDFFKTGLPNLMKELTGDKIKFINKVVISSLPLASIEYENAISMQDVDKDLNRYISPGAYDCVFVIYGMPYIPQCPLSGEGPNHTGWVSTVFCPDWNQPYSNGQAIVLREWLRSTGQLFYKRIRKLTNVPNIDTPEKFGYKINCCGKNNWFGFYKDYLNREIIYQGKDWGLGDTAWKLGSPRYFWYPKSYIKAVDGSY